MAHEHFFLKCHCTIIPNIPLAKIILNITICLYLPQAKSLTHTLSACYPTAYTVPPATTQLSSSTFIKKYNIQLIRPESSHAPQLTSYATAYSPPQLDSASLHLAVCCRQVLPLRNTAPSSWSAGWLHTRKGWTISCKHDGSSFLVWHLLRRCCIYLCRVWLVITQTLQRLTLFV